jgi:predicted ArsR family transcriptional regulator
MFLKHIRDIAKPQHFAIIDTLKRSTGMPVAELSRALDMSYMGVKQHCLDLEKKGWLDTWRRPVPNGRPEKLYRLTTKGASLFPEAGTEMLLDLLKSLAEIFGPTAPEKLLFSYFQKKTAAFAKKLKGRTPAEKASHLARLRSAEGHCAEMAFEPDRGLCMVEWHNPHAAIAAIYPSFYRHEEQMLQRLLGTAVQREEQKVSGLSRIVFRLPGISAAESQAYLETAEGAAQDTAIPCPPAVEEETPEPEMAAAPDEEAVVTPAAEEIPSPAATPPPVTAPALTSAPADELSPAPPARRSMKPAREECARLEELPLFTRYSLKQDLAEEVLSN